jgi:hypothetical protein
MLIFGNWIAFSGYETAEVEVKHIEVKHKEKTAVKIIELTTDNPEVETIIRETAYEACKKHSLGDSCVSDLLAMALTEKRDLNCNSSGDSGKSWGCFQIHLGYHPEITKEQAKDIKFAVNWTLDRLVANGYPKYRSIAIRSHNGSPNNPKTLTYLNTVNSFIKND